MRNNDIKKPEKILNIKLFENQIIEIIEGIKKLPYETAEPLLRNITNQLKEQT